MAFLCFSESNFSKVDNVQGSSPAEPQMQFRIDSTVCTFFSCLSFRSYAFGVFRITHYCIGLFGSFDCSYFSLGRADISLGLGSISTRTKHGSITELSKWNAEIVNQIVLESLLVVGTVLIRNSFA